MDDGFLQAIGLILGGGAVASFVTAWFTRRKTSAEAESTLSGSTMDFAKLLQQDITSLRNRCDISERKLAEAKIEHKITLDKLEQAERRVGQLKEIVEIARERDNKNTKLMHKLAQALKEYDPNHPLIRHISDQRTEV